MPLKNKYLKYSPEITLEIFTLVYNKLIECKFTPTHELKTAWKEFSGDYPTLWCQYKNHPNQFLECTENYSETTVQEILGYDPFIKEFVLPEKWKIQLKTPEHISVVGRWFDTNSKSDKVRSTHLYETKSIIGHNYQGWLSSAHGWGKDNDATEITFEQFKKYVLKKSIEAEEVVPEYVECIEEATSNTRIGEIFKCRISKGFFEFEYNDKSGPDYNSWDGWDTPWNDPTPKYFFKPSTKEAFDAQKKFKQPLKQAVQCKTQEEYKIVKEFYKENYLAHLFNINTNDCIPLDKQYCTSNRKYYENNNYQILSFQEWCDLNEYKMENKYKFEFGKWYKLNNCWWAKFYSLKENSFYMSELITADFKYEKRRFDNPASTDLNINNTIVLADIEEIQQYLPDGHPDKIQLNPEFKVGDYVTCIEVNDSTKAHGCGWKLNRTFKISKFSLQLDCLWPEKGDGVFSTYVRHATMEEINNHLISIGQIQAGEPLNTGITPNKDDIFKYTTYSGITYVGKTSTISGSLKMILSIDDEELPMVNIIKTKIVNLLNNN